MTVTKASAQPTLPIRFESLTINNGLSQGFISSIVQDKKGFMWFATSDGLNKYDGYTFTVYHHNPNDTTSIASDELTYVFEDSKERLWIGTRQNGIDLFDRKYGVFTHIRHTGANSLRSDAVFEIIEDRTGVFWIKTGQGIDRLEIIDEKPPGNKGYSNFLLTHKLLFMPIDPDAAFEAVKDKYQPAELFVDSRNRVLLTTNSKIWEVKFNNTLHSYSLIERFSFPVIDSTHVAGLIEDTVHHALFLNTKKILKFQDYNFYAPQEIQDDASTPGIWIIDKQQRMWQFEDSGILRTQLPSGRMEYAVVEDPVQAKALTFGTVMYMDRSGVVWIGTGGYGILKYDPEWERFHHILPQQYFYQLLESDDGAIVTNNLQAITIKKNYPVSSSSFVDAEALKKKFPM